MNHSERILDQRARLVQQQEAIMQLLRASHKLFKDSDVMSEEIKDTYTYARKSAELMDKVIKELKCVADEMSYFENKQTE